MSDASIYLARQLGLQPPQTRPVRKPAIELPAPPEFWADPQIAAALHTRDIAAVYTFLQSHGGVSQRIPTADLPRIVRL